MKKITITIPVEVWVDTDAEGNIPLSSVVDKVRLGEFPHPDLWTFKEENNSPLYGRICQHKNCFKSFLIHNPSLLIYCPVHRRKTYEVSMDVSIEASSEEEVKEKILELSPHLYNIRIKGK